MKRDPSRDDDLRCPLLDGDVEPWIRCCTSRFLPLAKRVAGSDAGARDALQESWIIVLQKINQYRGGPPACAWVRSIVRHEAPHGAQAKTREVPLRRPEGQAGLEETDMEAYRAELRRLLLEAIDHLPPTLREVVKLRDLEERTNTEVAEQLHISKQNVSVRLYRAHRLLRSRLLKHR